ncbi:Hypp9448 [Branchiostoma lanceolatum]|uniref:Hypp9448 protein n=1 Tax=Branchiostoma lanceolatum TaxID=7740 RepID=A0A8S4MM72_BRALA|nr:Hypp9448 [Branchiostoma lanceolatum]
MAHRLGTVSVYHHSPNDCNHRLLKAPYHSPDNPCYQVKSAHASNILLRILLKRMEGVADTDFAEAQIGFRKKVGIRDQIFNVRILIEKARESNVNLYMAFIDYKKAFDSVRHKTLWKVMERMGVSNYIVNSLRQLYRHQQAAVRVGEELTDWFEVTKGMRQGCLVSPICFNVYSEAVMRESAGKL